jgi:hypothetical protein
MAKACKNTMGVALADPCFKHCKWSWVPSKEVTRSWAIAVLFMGWWVLKAVLGLYIQALKKEATSIVAVPGAFGGIHGPLSSR